MMEVFKTAIDFMRSVGEIPVPVWVPLTEHQEAQARDFDDRWRYFQMMAESERREWAEWAEWGEQGCWPQRC